MNQMIEDKRQLDTLIATDKVAKRAYIAQNHLDPEEYRDTGMVELPMEAFTITMDDETDNRSNLQKQYDMITILK